MAVFCPGDVIQFQKKPSNTKAYAWFLDENADWNDPFPFRVPGSFERECSIASVDRSSYTVLSTKGVQSEAMRYEGYMAFLLDHSTGAMNWYRVDVAGIFEVQGSS